MFKILLKNTITQREYVLNDLTDESNDTFNYKFRVSLEDISPDEGEYCYWLLDENDNVLYNGIMQYGDYVEDKKEYTNENKVRKQYNK